ncbi:MAG: hypothetical protein GY822_22165 [Deltaproteobacteria bacterium]|nr:hypothetical protein [Deltaproteobacteria bacterium]
MRKKTFKKLHIEAQVFTFAFIAFVLIADARGQFVDVVGLFILGAIVRDVYEELSFRRTHGAVRSVRSQHRLALLAPYLALLQEAN